MVKVKRKIEDAHIQLARSSIRITRNDSEIQPYDLALCRFGLSLKLKLPSN